MGVCVAGQCSCTNGNDTCINGKCVCSGNNGQPCSGDLTCCGAAGCVDLRSDPANCDKCGHACAPDPLCCDSVCKPISPTDCGQCATNCSPKVCCPPCLAGGVYQCEDVCKIVCVPPL
jgi:hypothetical protein